MATICQQIFDKEAQILWWKLVALNRHSITSTVYHSKSRTSDKRIVPLRIDKSEEFFLPDE